MGSSVFHGDPTALIHQALAIETIVVLSILHMFTAVILSAKLVAFAISCARREYKTIHLLISSISSAQDDDESAPLAKRASDSRS